MKTGWLIVTVAAALGGAAPAVALDVNSPTIPMLERPPGPPSAPGVIVTGVPALTQTPTADPNAPLEGRATTVPATAPDPLGRDQPLRAGREGRVGAPPPATGR